MNVAISANRGTVAASTCANSRSAVISCLLILHLVARRCRCRWNEHGSDQTTHQRYQSAALILGSDGDAQEVLDPRFLEMSYENAALPQRRSEIRTAAARMAREDEVRERWENLEAELSEGEGQPFAIRHDALARLLKPGIVLDGRDRAGDGEAIKRVGVEAVLHPFQRLDEGSLADGKAYSEASERPRLGEGLDDKQIVVTRHQRYSALGAEIDVSLVDHH